MGINDVLFIRNCDMDNVNINGENKPQHVASGETSLIDTKVSVGEENEKRTQGRAIVRTRISRSGPDLP
jgi:hypothetical protein